MTGPAGGAAPFDRSPTSWNTRAAPRRLSGSGHAPPPPLAQVQFRVGPQTGPFPTYIPTYHVHCDRPTPLASPAFFSRDPRVPSIVPASVVKPLSAIQVRSPGPPSRERVFSASDGARSMASPACSVAAAEATDYFLLGTGLLAALHWRKRSKVNPGVASDERERGKRLCIIYTHS